MALEWLARDGGVTRFTLDGALKPRPIRLVLDKLLDDLLFMLAAVRGYGEHQSSFAGVHLAADSPG